MGQFFNHFQSPVFGFIKFNKRERERELFLEGRALRKEQNHESDI